MQRTINTYTLLLIIVCMSLLSPASFAQVSDYAATKEKVYLHTNHVFFKQGEHVFFKIYVVEANSQKPSMVSKVVYVDVIDPSGNVLQKMSYQVEHGYAEGSWDFREEAKGGVYKFRAYTTWMRNEQEASFITKEVTLQKVIAPRILLKLDIPGKGFGAGDEVMADFSMRSLVDQPIGNYGGTFTVSLGGNVVTTAGFSTNNEGKAQIKFRLPATLNTNDGLLNVTLQYDSYTESISRSIPILLNKIDLQFMPEGGTLVAGIPTHIAFKALNENGKAADVKGEIRDEQGKKVASFESYHFGMGKFAFTPKAGVAYKAVITSPANIKQQFALPEAKLSGLVMNVIKEDHKVLMMLESSGEVTVRIHGCSRGVTYYSKKMVLKSPTMIAAADSLFPPGISSFTVYAVYDLKEVPVAERLVFLHENKNLKVSVSTDKDKYLPREKVTMTLQTLDEQDKPIPSNFSLSVVDDKLWTFADDKQDHILSWLLMSSELKGKIEEPTFYFKKEEPKAVPALDLVMLTHGYRYFDFIDYVQREGKLQFYFDQGNILSGVVNDDRGNPLQSDIFLVNMLDQRNAIHFKTGEDGVFFFSQLAPTTNYYLLAKAINKRKKAHIRIIQNGIGYNPLQSEKIMLRAEREKYPAEMLLAKGVELKKKELAKENRQKELINLQNGYFNFEANNLNDVVVVGYGTAKKKDITGAISHIQSRDLSAPLLTALQGRVAGLTVVENTNPFDKSAVTIRGSRSISGTHAPLYIVDGSPVEQFKLHSLNPNDIESITILKDAAATALYGVKAVNGVIIIETKRFTTDKISFDLSTQYYYSIQTVRALGENYSVARKFYAPRYETTEVSEKTDFRETIYWNPVVQTDKNGKATVEFYNSDATTTFRAIAEGIGYNGKLGRAEATYAAQDMLTVDAKIPPYLTVGDKALIPLVIKNNSVRALSLSIQLQAPAYLKPGQFQGQFQLAPDSSRQILVPLEAMKPLRDTIRFSIVGGSHPVKLALPIIASEKGFPVVETFAGNRSVKYDFNIRSAIPGSMHSELKLLKSIEGQLLNGIESMLREPGGCFEQTSSSLYPNIYILKYLKSAGKSNPEVEKRALGYIRNGYKRLIGFETIQRGFEWFGKTPPHEALTAYGLLEFTDMAEFVEVDKQMLQRTKDFLLSRRDGKGGFKLATKGYDQFAAVPNKIAHLYIVYALSQAGIGNEIRPEYEAAVKQALESKDAYLMAMMALAASNMKSDQDYAQLMDALNTHFNKKELTSETSVVNSRGVSLQIETKALYALALMRRPQPDLEQIAGMLSQLMANKSYYGYGSTQGTVLALKAIVEYAQLANSNVKDADVLFAINDKKATSNSEVEATLQEGKNTFSVTYDDGRKGVPYNLEISYNTFTPPNSEKAVLQLATRVKNANPAIGETVRMEIEATNTQGILQPMSIAKIGIPAGLSVQPWQLKELMDKNQVAYYEIFDNWLVFYWMGFAPNETKKINLDLKADIPGTYRAKASNIYLYYTPEDKHWNEGAEVTVRP
ncbi:MAG: TonB-dependent receptor plug domain-containing protein [Niastella sp.]|nr:TonB-dependent receptor plug domain-containing protein [Niastella sp.]